MHPDLAGTIASENVPVMHQCCSDTVSCGCQCYADAGHSSADDYDIIFSIFYFLFL